MKRMIARILLFAFCLALSGAGALADTEYPQAGRGAGGSIDAMFDRMDKLQEAHAPTVRTLPNGVQIQRVPDEWANPGGGAWLAGDTLSYNTNILDADNRGCGACHTDLAALLNNSVYEHLDFHNDLNIELTVDQCLFCHGTGISKYYYTESFGFGTMIHGIHYGKDSAFSTMGGNCMTCHNATEDGMGLTLFDNVKHSLYRGIVDYSEFEADFTYTQDRITESLDDMFYVDWMYGQDDYRRYGAEWDDLPLDEELFNTWEFTVDGEVENPTTFNLAELIETAPVVTRKMTQNCIVNPTGGSLIYSAEVTGIPLSWIFEQVGLKEDSVFMKVGTDGFEMSFPITYANNDAAMLAYELNGQRLSWALGYPLLAWFSGLPSSNDVKSVKYITVTNEIPANWQDVPKYHLTEDRDRKTTGYYTQANVAIANLSEGQIIEAYQPYTFEGYAYACDAEITAVEFSLDRGATWTSYPVEGTDFNQWVWWNFTFTPEKEGAFVLMVRSVDSFGNVTETPREILVNAKL